MKKITDYTSCPHCGSEGYYYQRVKVKGAYLDKTKFGDETDKDNEGMADCLTETWQSRYYYCDECDKRICKAEL